MKYGRDREWVRNVLKGADVDNTFNGGISKPNIQIKNKSLTREIYIKIPGVETDQLKIEIINDQLTVRHFHNFIQEGCELQIPRLVGSFPITQKVDYNDITAEENNGFLKIEMPFNELNDDFYRKIDIKK